MAKRLTGFFPILIFILTVMSANSYTANRPYMTYVAIVVAGLGVITFLVRLIPACKYKAWPMLALVLAFLASYGFSTFMNRDLGVTENVKGLLWLGLFALVVFPSGCFEKLYEGSTLTPGLRLLTGKARTRKVRQIRYVFCDIIIIYTGLAALASLITMLLGVDSVNYGVAQGMYCNRLYGVFTDPNYGSILCLCGILLSLIYLLRGLCSRWAKPFLVLQIVLCYLYIIFGFSRTGFFMMCATFLLLLLYYIFVVRAAAKKILLLAALLVAMCVLVTPICDAYNAAMEEADEEELTIIREADIEDDFTNIRLEIWKDGLDAFRANPIYGISYRNIHEWFAVNRPDSFMINYNYGLNTFHNTVIDVLASQGLIGIIIFAVTVLWCIVRIVKLWKKSNILQRDQLLLFGLPAIAVAGGAIMLTDIFYITTPTAVVFWYGLGQCLSLEERYITIKEVK